LIDSLFEWLNHLSPIYEEDENLRTNVDEESLACRDASSHNMDSFPSYGKDGAFQSQSDSVHSSNKMHAFDAFNYSLKVHKSDLIMLILTLAHL
jgi:hypothetical protein